MKNTNKYKFTKALIILSIILNLSKSNAYDNIIIGENNEIIEFNQKYKHLNQNINDSKLSSSKYLTILDSIKFGVTPQIFYYNDNHQLDSAVIPFQSKYVTKYDQNNKLILEEYYENWGLGDTVLWAGTHKYEYSFDEKNRLFISTEYYPRNDFRPNISINVDWNPLNQIKYIYNDSTNKLESYYNKTNFSTNDTLL